MRIILSGDEQITVVLWNYRNSYTSPMDFAQQIQKGQNRLQFIRNSDDTDNFLYDRDNSLLN